MNPAARLLALALLAASMAAFAASAPPSRDGGDILQRFHQGLAEPGCDDASPRWRHHYARAAERLADDDETALALFGYVLDRMLTAGLPSEYALIPFVETRYHPDARSRGGPAGLWQFTAGTARLHGLRVRGGIDERMSAAASTDAAIAHLARLHRLFGGRWRDVAMAYNAGEGALRASRRKGGRPLSGITRSYPNKLHAIACLFDAEADRPRWRNAVARPVARLAARTLPAGTRDLRRWARDQGLDPALVRALNPGWHPGSRQVVAPVAGEAGRTAPGEAN